MSRVIEHMYKIKNISENVNAMDVYVAYSLGGFNPFTYKREERGYYFHAQPCKDGDGWREFVAFSGYKQIIVPCGRRSKKAEAEAVEWFNNHKRHTVAEWFPQYELEV